MHSIYAWVQWVCQWHTTWKLKVMLCEFGLAKESHIVFFATVEFIPPPPIVPVDTGMIQWLIYTGLTGFQNPVWAFSNQLHCRALDSVEKPNYSVLNLVQGKISWRCNYVYVSYLLYPWGCSRVYWGSQYLSIFMWVAGLDDVSNFQLISMTVRLPDWHLHCCNLGCSTAS